MAQVVIRAATADDAVEVMKVAVQHDAVYLHASPHSQPPIVLVKRLASDPDVAGTGSSISPLR